MKTDLVILIISNNRPDNVITYKTLKDAECSIPIYIVVDNTDNSVDQYRKNFGEDKVIVFNKEEIAKTTDHGDNFWNLRTTTHARNACFNISRDLGFTYFLVLDDDYTEFKFRINKNLNHPTGHFKIKKKIDEVFLNTLEYFKSCQFTSICFSQGGDWFGGEQQFNKKPKRKAMNSWFCSVDRPFKFISRLNEDVNTYMKLGSMGEVFLTIPFVQLDQLQTQQNKGGMTDAYIDGGTFVKSFYTVMYCPSFTKIITMERTNRRLHHKISWPHAVPLIIDERHKKKLNPE